jgi:CheY-like chemotaxis protein
MARILLVEDELDSLEMMQVLLELEGYEVVAATNGKEALEKLARLRPDLIVTDVMMPFMSGEQLLTEIGKRSDLASIPVIVMSAGDGGEVAARFHAPYVKKPINVRRFLQLVRSSVDGVAGG